MLDEKYLSKENYEIIDNPSVFAVDYRLANIVSILNKKGYYTSGCDISCVEKSITCSNMLQRIFEQNVIDNSVDEKIIKYILMYGSGSIFITFDNLENISIPTDFYKIKNGLACDVIPVKEVNGKIHIKTKEELNLETNEKLEHLINWAKKLPDISCD